MFATSLRKLIKWRSTEVNVENNKSLLLIIIFNVIEDLISWERPWLSANFLLLCNGLFFLFSYQEIKFSVLLLYLSFAFISIDGLEAWLRHKHRTSFLKHLAFNRREKITNHLTAGRKGLAAILKNYIFAREANPTKVFLIGNIIFITAYLVGTYVSGFLLTYLICTLGITFNILQPLILSVLSKILVSPDSDSELDSLIPEISDATLQELSFEAEIKQGENQSLDLWKPDDDVPVGEISDSSDTSSSMATNFSMEKMRKEVDAADISNTSDEDDEYIPLVDDQQQLLPSTKQIVHPPSWGESAFNMLQSITGAVTNIGQPKEIKRERLPSADSSDGFEIIERRDLT